jgi:hypothetical protein
MVITDVTRVTEGSYEVTSLPCPVCKDTLTVGITSEQLRTYRENGLVQNVFPDLPLPDRERFISGYCPKDWWF